MTVFLLKALQYKAFNKNSQNKNSQINNPAAIVGVLNPPHE
jgi:hypothetical protein